MIRRESWTGRLGFIVTAAGSAIGLGNIWRFPYVAGENGGGAFLLVYLGIAFSIGLGLVLAEMALGSVSQLPPVKGGEKEFGKKIGSLFYLTVLSSFLLSAIYMVVGGWTLIYSFESIYSHFSSGSWTEFGEIISSPETLIAGQAAFILATVGVVVLGIRNGLEKCCSYLMPALFIIILVLVIRAITMDGAMEGLQFYLTPDFSKITAGTALAALGMAFFSLSLGMGTIITYASYLKKGSGVLSSGTWMVVLDTSVCFLAGMFIFPAVFSAGIDPSGGPMLVFEVLPKIFNELPMGFVFSFVFFLLLFFAALTSAISLLEVICAHFVADGYDRKKVAVISGIVVLVSGIPCILAFNYWSDVKLMGLNMFDMVDKAVTVLLMPINGIVVSVLVGWAMSKKACGAWLDEGHLPGSVLRFWQMLWINCCRFLFPLTILYIMVDGIWEFVGAN